MSSFINKYSDTEKLSPDEKNKEWQREFLMDRLRSHHPQHKLSYTDLSKAIRMAMLEKRYALDAVEKSNLQKCLDSMQHCIKVTTRQGLVERLESLSRQLGLKFMEDSSGLFISSDMFFLEIILDVNGMLTDVKVHHECKIEQQSCSELVTCLLRGDFADFTSQLEGLSSIYQLNAEPKVKSKAFVALQAMETDLYNLFKWQSLNKDMPTLLKESPVGIVQKRRGGHPMKLTYFVSSYDLLSLKSKAILPLTMELLKNKDIGMNVTVHLEASSANKLQILPSVTLSKDNNFPIYASLSQNNSTLLPATFVLRLNEPLPVCSTLLETIGSIEESGSTSGSILQLTIQVASKGLIKKSSKEFFVSLPDQSHCYFFTENKNMQGSIITSVPFTEPSQVPKILSALKQQALFYTFLASCVRTDGKLCSITNTTMLEVNAISLQKISVALQHSNEDSLVSVEFEFKDISNINVKLFSVASATNYEVFNQKLTKFAESTLSIPLTIRYLLKLWENEQVQSFFHHCNTENGKFVLGNSNNDVNPRTGNRCGNFRDTKMKFERNNGNTNDNTTNSDNLFSRTTFFNSSAGQMTSSDLLFSDTNLLNSSNPSVSNQFGIKTEQIKDFTSSSLQQEDFCKRPKSNISVNSNNKLESCDLHSLGNKNNLQTTNMNTSSIEKVKNVTKKAMLQKNNLKLQEKKSNKNTVSITPVMTNKIIDMQTDEQSKRLELEIIPLLPNTAIPSLALMSVNKFKSTNHQTFIKKKCDERQNNQHKIDKKRRRKDNSTSNDKIGLKILDFANSSLTVENIESLKRQYNSSNKTKLDKSLSNISKQSYSIHLPNGSIDKPNLISLKSATKSSKCLSISKKSQKRKPEFKNIDDVLSPVTQYSMSVENHLSNASDLSNGVSSSNQNSNKIFQTKLGKHENLSTVINKLRKEENTVNNIDNLVHKKIDNIFTNHVHKAAELNEKCTSKYMIKPGVNGMKLTINKTKSSESLKQESFLNNKNVCDFRGQTSNKIHTGLKPGVSSGPASKSRTTGLPKSATNKNTFHKSYSSECLTLNKDGTNHAYMGKSLSKSLSSNSLNTKSALLNVFGKDKNSIKTKLSSSKIPENYFTNIQAKSVEGLIKTLNTNFQIPKLSAKSSDSDRSPEKKKDINNMSNITESKTMFNLTGINNLHIQKNEDTNPRILLADIPQIKNVFDVNNECKSFVEDNNHSTILNKITKLDSYKKNKIHYTAKSTKAPNSILSKKPNDQIIEKINYPPQTPSLSMHIIKTPVSSATQTSLLNSTCIDKNLMDEALIEIGSK